MAKSQKAPSFEEQLHQLDEIIAALEQGELPLEKTISEYKRGIEISRLLRAQLEGARKELTVLSGAEGESESDADES